MAPLVDGNAYYWASVNPRTYPGQAAKLARMGEAVHARGGIWIPSAAPGFDARRVGGTSVVERRRRCDPSRGAGRRRELVARRDRPDQLERVQREHPYRAESQRTDRATSASSAMCAGRSSRRCRDFDSSEPAATDFSYGVPLLGGLASSCWEAARPPHPSTVEKPPIGGLWAPAGPPTLESPWLLGTLTVALGLIVPFSAEAAADPVIMAAGDIACDPADPGYNGGAGTADRCHQQATSDLLLSRPLDAVLPLGDIQYDSATTARINAVYAPTWGRVKSITRPILGNHESGSGIGLLRLLQRRRASRTGPAGPRGKGYYSFDLGAWHLVALNSNCSSVSCSAGSEQETWLRADLAAHPANCTLAYWHHPRFSSGHDGSNDFMQPLWEALQDAQAELVLSGHSHDYERFAPLDRDGEVDQARGHSPVRGRHGRRVLHGRLGLAGPAQRGRPERHVRRPQAHASPRELRLAVRP